MYKVRPEQRTIKPRTIKVVNLKEAVDLKLIFTLVSRFPSYNEWLMLKWKRLYKDRV